VKEACEEHGFFQLVNHKVPVELQEAIIQQSKEFFKLPLDVKEKYDKGRISPILRLPFC